jgi:arylsulfatase A-like enzyme
VWQDGVKAGMDIRDVKVPACLPDNETTRTDLCDYFEKIQQFDKFAAEMLAMLEASGQLDNTIVVMSGDNGMPFPRCKATLYDLGTRVPLAIRWGDKVPGGRTVEDFVSLCDLAPTFLEAAGLKPAQVMTGRTLLPILASNKSGQVEPARDHVLTAMEQHVFAYPSRAIRTADYLYVVNFGPANWRTGQGDGPVPTYEFTYRHWPSGAEAFSFNIDPSPTKQFMLLHPDDPAVKPVYGLSFGQRPEEELYDLKADPGQLKNVADAPGNAEIKQNLRARLEAELQASEDPRILVERP